MFGLFFVAFVASCAGWSVAVIWSLRRINAALALCGVQFNPRGAEFRSRCAVSTYLDANPDASVRFAPEHGQREP